MKKLQCLALDDEPLALGLLSEYIRKTPFLELVDSCDNAVKALNIIHNQTIDLIFSDIQMNDLSGLELARVIGGLDAHKKPLLIFTTAYEQYALEGYKVDAIDYLLKPFSYEQFLKAASKAQSFHEKADNQPKSRQTDEYILFKVEYQYEKVFLKNILYIEGLKDYVKVHTVNRENPLLSLMSLKKLESRLPQDQFMRIHRSFIVNLDKVDIIGRTYIRIGKNEIPVSDNYRETLQAYFKDKMND
ncbi:MAG: LytTR family DNA-binding domain-containing protein [Cyclobacteriaceae bacterium]